MIQKIKKIILAVVLTNIAGLTFSQGNSAAIKSMKDASFSTGDVVAFPVIGYSPENVGKFLRSPSNLDSVGQVVAFLKKNPQLVVEVAVHSDHKAQDKFNLTWTENLAKSIQSYLIEKGIPATQLTAVGYGETKPKVLEEELTVPGKSKTTIPAGTTLTGEWIDSNFPAEKKKPEFEFVSKQNRRIEIRILK